MGPRAMEHLRALLYTHVRDGMKPRYRILRRSLGSVFMLPAAWCDSEVRALATEAVLIKLESPEKGARSRARGNGHHLGFAGPGPCLQASGVINLS